MLDLKRPWSILKSRVLLRKIPHTLVSWRFVLPCSGSIGLHRRVFLGAWVELPRPVYALVVLYSLTLWFGYQGWSQLIRAYRIHANRIAEEYGVGGLKQLGHLCVAVGRGIPPSRYYGMQLYGLPMAGWWDYVFDHELPHWHKVMQDVPATRYTQRLLTDKLYFARELSAHNLPCVPTVLAFRQGDDAPRFESLLQRDLFLKPVSGARAEGCFALHFNAVTGGYQLRHGEVLIVDEARARAMMATSFSAREYLVQPLLRNEAQLEAQLVRATGALSERISTLRIVTSSGASGIGLHSANLERSAADYQRWKLYPVDIASGRVEVEKHLISLPFWFEIVQLVRSAHSICADQLTIGWDVAMTDDGPRLLEGNINWGVQAHQVAPRRPLLAGPMHKVYGAHHEHA